MGDKKTFTDQEYRRLKKYYKPISDNPNGMKE